MNRWQQAVAEFHRETEGTIGLETAIRDRELRAKLIMEEAVETVAALGFHVTAEINEPTCDPRVTVASFEKLFHEPDLIEYIDGMCDLIYVVAGSAVAAGVDLEPHFEEVHRANMMKLTGPKREDGKQLKPEGWLPPDHQTILDNIKASWSRFLEYLEREEAHNQELENWLNRVTRDEEAQLYGSNA